MVALYLVGTWFGILSLGLVLAEMIALPILAQHGWLIEGPFLGAAKPSVFGEGTAILGIFGLGWLYSSARDGANRALQRALDTISESSERYRLISETTSAVPWEFKLAEGRFTYVGPQALQTLGHPLSAWSDLKFLRGLFPREDWDRLKAEVVKALPDAGHFESEFRMTAADGHLVDLRCVGSLSADAQGCVRGLLLDVTERKKLEAELQQAQKLESVGRLASGIAHEINTPVQFVNDSVHFIQEAFRDTLALLGKYRQLRAQTGEGSVSSALLADLDESETAADMEYVTANVPRALERSVEGLDRVATLVRSMKEFAHPD
jgi:PAS domain S-box-containing protein